MVKDREAWSGTSPGQGIPWGGKELDKAQQLNNNKFIKKF